MRKNGTFMVFSAGLLAAAMLFAVTGCGTGAAGTPSALADQETANLTDSILPAAGISGASDLDVLKIGVADLPATMDPQRSQSNVGSRLYFNVFDTTIWGDQSENYALKPMLAESWERVDERTVDIKLREDVKFHNGDAMTAKDVRFSIYRLREKLSGMAEATALASTIEEISIIDDYNIRVISYEADPLIETRLSSTWGLWILPADYVQAVGDEAFGTGAIGTGPYRLESFSPDRIVLERFEDFYGEKPVIRRIEYIRYPETSSRLTALITGEVDMITQLPPDHIPTVEKEENLEVKSINLSNMHLVVLTGERMLEDQKLRQALSLAIDRQLLSDTLWGGRAIVPRGHQYPEYGDLYIEDYPLPEYNPEKARQLLAESNYNGEEIAYETRDGYYTMGLEAAEAIVDMWNQIGVNARVSITDTNENLYTRNWSNTMRLPDPVGGIWNMWGPSTTNWPFISEEAKAVGTQLERESDPAKKKELARKMMEYYDTEAPGTVLYYPLESWGMRKGFEWEPLPSQMMNFRAEGFQLAVE